MKKILFHLAVILLGMLIIPMSVFAVQSGGGYIVYDQVSNSLGVNLSVVPSSSTPTPAPTPSIGGGSGSGFSQISPSTDINVNNPVIPQELVFNPVVAQPIALQPQNISINQNTGTASIGDVLLEQPALFDIAAEPGQPQSHNARIFLTIAIILLVLIAIWILFFAVKHILKKRKIAKLIKESKEKSEKFVDNRSGIEDGGNPKV